MKKIVESAPVAPSTTTTTTTPPTTDTTVTVTKTFTDRNSIIRLLVKENPKRGASRQRYQCYKDGMTVDEYCKAVGSKGMADIRWDAEREFIKLEKKQ